jgi:CheY-like chemotaxis protein
MSRIITGNVRIESRPVEIAAIVQASIDAVRPAAAAKGIKLEVSLDPGAGQVAGDPDRLQQITWNLVSNAIKFTPGGGRVEVGLERVGPQVEIRVSDNGIGINRQFLPHVFERFRQADASMTRSHSGLGLGLSIVRHLVELHGGTVEAISDGEGRGATFVVRLPAVTGRQVGESPAAIQRGEGPSGLEGTNTDSLPRLDGLRLLVVDDEPDTRDLLIVMLRQCGAEVRTAASVNEALAALIQSRPDVLVSDIGMPDEDGYSLIEKVRAMPEVGEIPAVALTAHARKEDRERSLSAGFDAHLAKPMEPEELAAVISNLARPTRKGSS